MQELTLAAPTATTATPTARDARLKQVAEDLEASFLKEMLSHAGLGEPAESMGGGAGEEAFSSLLVGEQAKLLAHRGGIGLAQSLFEALKARDGGA